MQVEYLRDKAITAHKILGESYDDTSSMLNHRSPWELLVAVALSAQTTDNQVNKVSPRLFATWPGPAELAEADISAIEEVVHSTGFYRSKARNIKAAAVYVCELNGGTVPSTMEELVKIPGIGRKSAGVILHHVYDEPAIIVDTHFGRVVSRLGLLGKDVQNKKPDPLKTERAIAAILPREHWSNFSMTANLHGRKYCFSREPECLSCPLKGLCDYNMAEEKKRSTQTRAESTFRGIL